jgi:polyisoprenoid-binding protein YceI
MIAKIDVAELQRWRRQGRDFALVDVLPEEAFASRHLPGARRASVYEVTFLDQIRELGLAADDVIVLYGAGDGSLESAFAAEKLVRAGFSHVHDFSGGRAAWAKAGGPFDGTGADPPPPRPPEDGTWAINTESSQIEWIGRNLNSTHRGMIRIAHGEIVVRNGGLSSGRIVIDMNSITNTDLDDPALRQLLVAHLKSDDFFDVERFPSAELIMESAEPLPGATPGSSNFQLTGRLSMKDVNHPISFPTIISAGEGSALMAVAQIEIDRTRWNVLYGSGRFFRMLGKHMVNDMITLLVKVVAERAAGPENRDG